VAKLQVEEQSARPATVTFALEVRTAYFDCVPALHLVCYARFQHLLVFYNI